jgi:hypothetical protein
MEELESVMLEDYNNSRGRKGCMAFVVLMGVLMMLIFSLWGLCAFVNLLIKL